MVLLGRLLACVLVFATAVTAVFVQFSAFSDVSACGRQLDMRIVSRENHIPVTCFVAANEYDVESALLRCAKDGQFKIFLRNESASSSELKKPRRDKSMSPLAAVDESAFSNLEEIESRMRRVAASLPEFVTFSEFGRSVQERTIYALRIGLPNAKRQALFIGAHHAREWIAAETTIGIAEYIADKFRWNSRLRQLFFELDVVLWCVPVGNPDGFAFSHEGGDDEFGGSKRMWRKNRQVINESPYGVDLNRNFPFQWGGLGSEGSVASELYRGESAASEPEVSSLLYILGQTDNFKNLVLFISFHNYGKIILYPYGYSSTATSPADSMLKNLANAMRGAMKLGNGTVQYDVSNAGANYPAAGDAVDHIHLLSGYIPAFTIEVRPGNTECCGFIAPEWMIAPTVRENTIAALFAMEYSARADAADVVWTTHIFDPSLVKADADGDGISDYLDDCPLFLDVTTIEEKPKSLNWCEGTEYYSIANGGSDTPSQEVEVLLPGLFSEAAAARSKIAEWGQIPEGNVEMMGTVSSSEALVATNVTFRFVGLSPQDVDKAVKVFALTHHTANFSIATNPSTGSPTPKPMVIDISTAPSSAYHHAWGVAVVLVVFLVI